MIYYIRKIILDQCPDKDRHGPFPTGSLRCWFEDKMCYGIVRQTSARWAEALKLWAEVGEFFDGVQWLPLSKRADWLAAGNKEGQILENPIIKRLRHEV